MGGAEHRLPGAGTRPGLCGRRGVQAPGAGPGDGADEQAGLDPGTGRARDRRTVVSHDQAAAAGLCDTGVARALASVCAAHVGFGPATLVLYDVTTLYFETDEGDGFREPGFSKERRLEPQITVGLLTDVRGFPLQVHAFDGNTAETKTILPVIEAFAAAHGLPEVTVVADAGMLSEANLAAIEDAGLKFIVGAGSPTFPTR